MRRIVNFLLFLILLELSGCGSDPETVNTDFDYLPLSKGHFQIYDVHEVQYTVANDPLILDYELKMTVVDSFLNVSNRYTYVIYRYTRDNSSASWTYLDTWSARTDQNKIIVGEETTDFVKMRVPVTAGSAWDGNAFNGMEAEEYEVEFRGEPCTIGDQSFNDCAKIIHSDLDDIIVMTDLRNEIYARHVGLVYREETILTFCTTGCSGFGEIESGIEYTQTIKSYGVE